MVTVSATRCESYELDVVRRAMVEVLVPLGGMARFVRPGMKVLLKPNQLSAASPEQAVATHPAVLQVVAELVQQAGGDASIGDSPAGPVEIAPQVWTKTGMAEAASRVGAPLVLFKEAEWKRLNGCDYFIARPLYEADLVINLPKIKTHNLTLYTGAVKNLFGAIPGTRKRELHLRAPGMPDFSGVLADVLELVKTGLTIIDGVIGLEGEGPGTRGTPHAYQCLAASSDPLALDTVITRAMGYRPGEVLHLAEAGARGLGVADLAAIEIAGEPQALSFGPLRLPTAKWFLRVPSWMGAPVYRATRRRPQVLPALCIGCGRCAQVCPAEVITVGKPPAFALDRCIGCLCCAEICPQAAITVRQNALSRLLGVGR
jgi:uncharacterized protein (DUF362 family)/Pyruvate/2-oxoacid:ferredoxin oxidoreductase delta subunit